MIKVEKKRLVREFEKAHNEYSIKNSGYFKPNWKKALKYADLKNGYWYWKGYRLADLIK